MTNSLSYISGGRLGDFIHQLSVINEYYIITGKKGILYIYNIGDYFLGGLENTYNFTYELIKKQPYIEDYKIYNNEPIDIDLSFWRMDVTGNFYDIFKRFYNIEWGKNKWLHNVEYNEKWVNKIIINTVDYRFGLSNINFSSLFEKYGNDLCYVSILPEQYDFFKTKTNLNIEYYKPNDFNELCIIINSCKLFIGSLSSALSIATSLHKNCIYCNEIFLGQNLNRHLPFISYEI